MGYRSEKNRIGNKKNYVDLSMSQYPTTLDTRNNNTNMRGFVNVGEGVLPDWVMAEYVNASQDAIMALQRAIGETPMVPFDTPASSVTAKIEGFTVSDRIARIEDGLFDVRYGGPGWRNVASRPTLSNHNHDGLNGHPGKIHLQREIESLLLKKNIELSPSRGLTGADIYLSSSNPIKINIALEDFLSKSKGGTVEGPVVFNKGVKTRTSMDIRADEMAVLSGTSLSFDSEASAGKALIASSVGTTVRLFNLTSTERKELLYGKYVFALRVKLNVRTTGSVLRFGLGSNIETISAEDLTYGNYKQLYFVFEQDDTTKAQTIYLNKLATSGNVGLSIDSVVIQPMHPAVLDR